LTKNKSKKKGNWGGGGPRHLPTAEIKTKMIVKGREGRLNYKKMKKKRFEQARKKESSYVL
jgi:hypothetical protein